jgi:hypothetical protein
VWSNRAEAHRQDSALPAFESARVAERQLLALRDRSLGWLDEFARKRGVALPHERAGLETLEDLYFRVFVDDRGLLVRRHRSAFESAMGFFFGAVAAREGATWTVQESPFAPGHFALGVQRGQVTVLLNKLGQGWERRPNNERRRLLRREYERFFG